MDEIGKEEAEHAAATRQHVEVETELDSWRVDWAEKMRSLGLGADASPEQADLVLAEIRKLSDHLKEAKSDQSQIADIDREAERFVADAKSLVSRVASDLSSEPAAIAAEMLNARLKKALRDAQDLKGTNEQIEKESANLAKAEESQKAAQLELEVLCRDARCNTVEELPAAEQRSERRSQLESDLTRCEAQIRDQSAGASIEDFAAEIDQLNPDELAPRIEDLGQELTGMQAELDELNQRIGTLRGDIARMDGGSKAAEANETAGFALAKLQELVPRYAVLRLAASVLQQGSERFRKRNQGPVLDRASQIFASLTMGSFEGLSVKAGDG